MATIHDVARAAGVSAKTVSRVLNGDGPVGAATRAVVEGAMAALGYVPSSAARSMRSNRSGLVGLVTGAISGAPDARGPDGLPELLIVQGIQRVIAECDMTLMVADTGGRADRVAPLLRTFLEHRAEGLIYVAPYHQRVGRLPVPPGAALVLANCFDEAGTPAVIPDDRAGQRALTERLVAAGHRRIAYLTLDEGMVATDLRSRGYRDALDAAGLAFDPALLATASWGGGPLEAGRLARLLDRLLQRADPPSVLMCGNDAMALRVYGILRSRGLRVPEDVSVAGYDDHRIISETLWPPLTTAELPYAAMGERAARRLLALMAGEEPAPGPELVAGPVRWRESVTERTIHDHQRLTGGLP